MKKFSLPALFSICIAVLLAFSSTFIFAKDDKSKEKKKIKIACIGDSITYGLGIKNSIETGYPAKLQTLLGDQYEVKNFGNSGRGVILSTMRGPKEPRAYMKQKSYTDAMAFEPDIVICNLGINDCDEWHKNDAKKEEFRKDYLTLIESFQNLKTKPKIFIWTRLAPILKGHRFYDSAQTKWAFQMRLDLDAVAEKADVFAIDMFTPLFGCPDIMQGDGIHPNELGAQRIADATYAQVLPMIENRPVALELPWFVQNKMVVPADEPFTFVCKTNPKEKVKAGWNSANQTFTADNRGLCKITLPKLAYEKTAKLMVQAGKEKKEIKDVIAGEVFLFVGQSNIVFRVNEMRGGTRAKVTQEPSKLRIISRVSQESVFNQAWGEGKKPTYIGNWTSFDDTKGIQTTSAVAHQFLEHLSTMRPGVYGAITVSVGGCTMESLVSDAALLQSNTLCKSYQNTPDNMCKNMMSWPVLRMKQNLAKNIKTEGPFPQHYYMAGYNYENQIKEVVNAYHFKGAIYYQGESNATLDNASKVPAKDVDNEELMRACVRLYQGKGTANERPLIMIELPKMNRPWEAYRALQKRVCEEEKAQLCSIFEFGEMNDVHPRNKSDVGLRLAEMMVKELPQKK